jgi:hypothetical protein
MHGPSISQLPVTILSATPKRLCCLHNKAPWRSVSIRLSAGRCLTVVSSFQTSSVAVQHPRRGPGLVLEQLGDRALLLHEIMVAGPAELPMTPPSLCSGTWRLLPAQWPVPTWAQTARCTYTGCYTVHPDSAGAKWDSAGAKWDSAGGRWDSAGGKWDSAGAKWDSAGAKWESAGAKWDSAGVGLGGR